MQNQKLENQLNLALDATQREREKSVELDIGYEPEEAEWELIIKYSGELSEIRNIAVTVSDLLNEYAVITIKESRIDELADLPEVEYIEKPKRLYFQVENGKRVSCINEVQDLRFDLFGQGILIGIVDSGIDYTLQDFRNEDGSTRIRSLWDQSLVQRENEQSPDRYERGVEYTQEDINEALDNKLVRSKDLSGHGTAVAGIAAGSGTVYRGVAPESELIVVKMGNARQEGFPRTTELMMGIDYVIRKAMEFRMPVAINVSFGNTYGAHEPYN